jgi:hypothetical protein
MPLTIDEKYELYESSVQNPGADIDFINENFQKIFQRAPLILREDFGGTGYLACEWVKQSPENPAYVIDLDSEPIEYGKRTHYARLSEDQKGQVSYFEKNVLSPMSFSPDVIVAFNFSYFIFKERKLLKEYFQKVYDDLPTGGMFCIDLFGGEDAYETAEEETEHENHSYFWDCDKFNPLTNECLYYIHFKKHSDHIKHEKVFTYDWRMWSNAELRDLFSEVGFSDVISFWEGVDEDGDGDGHFIQTLEAENCESWVTYLVGIKR